MMIEEKLDYSKKWDLPSHNKLSKRAHLTLQARMRVLWEWLFVWWVGSLRIVSPIVGGLFDVVVLRE
jgi:hypothetical protein